jgi:hypothetical protein
MQMSRSGPSINVECDGCGDVVEVELPPFPIDHEKVISALLEKLKWHLTPDGEDLCPDCSGKEVCDDCGEHVDYVEHCMGCCEQVCLECAAEHAEKDCSQHGDSEEPDSDDQPDDDSD